MACFNIDDAAAGNEFEIAKVSVTDCGIGNKSGGLSDTGNGVDFFILNK